MCALPANVIIPKQGTFMSSNTIENHFASWERHIHFPEWTVLWLRTFKKESQSPPSLSPPPSPASNNARFTQAPT